MSVSFVGCKDYDDDIDEIHETTDGLSKQISALETALKANQDAVQAAANAAQQAIKDAADAAAKGDQALAEAKAAAAQAELAKQAAAQAKADAIAEVIAQLKPLIDSNTAGIQENANKIAEILGRIDGIEADLKKIDLDAVNSQVNENTRAIEKLAAQQQAIETQVKALESFKAAVEAQLSTLEGKVSGLASDLAAVKAKADATATELTALQAEVAKLQTAVAANTADIATINGKITTINGQLQELSTKITTEVNNALSTIAGTMSRRLTSVTLMPDLYVGGIPTIEFLSANYVSKVQDANGNWVVNTSRGSKTFIVSNNETEAQYRLNPATIGEDDIVKTGLAYVSRIATARAAEVENDIVNVASSSVDNGVLTVKLGKSNTASLNLAGDKIYTISLKVPVAEKHLFTEQGETSFSVYSEYTRLAETYFTPELRFTDVMKNSAVNSHLNDSITMYAAGPNELVAKNIVYDKPYDLDELVYGCQLFSDPVKHVAMTHEQMEKYGFDIKYRVANHVYTAATSENTNQQLFAKIEGSTLTPKLPTGETANKGIIGRQPIIAATLVDVVNNKVIEQKYFKVKFTAMEFTPLPFELPTHTSTLVCGDQDWTLTWREVQDNILNKYPENGISKDDFIKIYDTASGTAKRDDTNTPAGDLYYYTQMDGEDASTNILRWVISDDELGKLVAGKTYSYTAVVTFENSQELYAPVVVTLKWNVTVPAVPVLGDTDKTKWQNEVMLVYPVPMPDPDNYAGTPTAEYATNILEGRNKPYVKNLLPCANWDLDFNSVTPYQGVISYDSPYGHWLMNSANQANLGTISYTIPYDASGIALVARTLATGHYDIDLAWSTDINGLTINRYKFAHSTLRLLQILKLQTLAAGELPDDSKANSLNLNDALRLNDAYGHLVAKNVAKDYANKYYVYYGVKDPVFGTGNDIKIADDANGTNIRSLAGLNMVANVNVATGELTFQNNGAPLQADAYLIIPVKVEHKWGVLEGNLAVKLAKKL